MDQVECIMADDENDLDVKFEFIFNDLQLSTVKLNDLNSKCKIH